MTLQIFKEIEGAVNTDFDSENRYLMPSYKSLAVSNGFETQEKVDSISEYKARTRYFIELLIREHKSITAHIHETFSAAKSKEQLVIFVEAAYVKAATLKEKFNFRFQLFQNRKKDLPDSENIREADLTYGLLEWYLVDIFSQINSNYSYLLSDEIKDKYDIYKEPLRDWRKQQKKEFNLSYEEYTKKVEAHIKQMPSIKEAIKFLLSELRKYKTVQVHFKDDEEAALSKDYDISYQRNVDYLNVQIEHLKDIQKLMSGPTEAAESQPSQPETKSIPVRVGIEKLKDLKTYEDTILESPYLESIYMELSKIQNQFHCLEDFINQTLFIKNDFLLPMLAEKEKPDAIIKTLQLNLGLWFNYNETSLEYFFHCFLMSELLLASFKEIEKKNKQPMPLASLLQKKLELIFYEGIKQFPIQFETDKDNIRDLRVKETNGVQGANFKWWVYPLSATKSKRKEMESTPALPKVKTNLTVAQLSFLFDMLREEKIFESSQAAIEKFAVANFSSKKQENISQKSFHNKLTEITPKEKEDLRGILMKLATSIKTDIPKTKKK